MMHSNFMIMIMTQFHCMLILLMDHKKCVNKLYMITSTINHLSLKVSKLKQIFFHTLLSKNSRITCTSFNVLALLVYAESNASFSIMNLKNLHRLK